MSDTPRTDYAATLVQYAVVGEQYQFVTAEFARELERDLGQMVANRDEWELKHANLALKLAELEEKLRIGQIAFDDMKADYERRGHIGIPAGLHPATVQLVLRFATALAEKLRNAEEKYGYDDGWMGSTWMDECRTRLREHIEKGDPRDVAAYCAFLWHHGESTNAARSAVAAPIDLEAEAKDYRFQCKLDRSSCNHDWRHGDARMDDRCTKCGQLFSTYIHMEAP